MGEESPMLPPKIAALYGEMEKVREETLSSLSGLTEEEFSRRVEGEWSAAQILHHILMAETGTSKVIRKSIKSSVGTLPLYPADDSVLDVRKLPKPVGAYQAPEAVRQWVPKAAAAVPPPLCGGALPTTSTHTTAWDKPGLLPFVWLQGHTSGRSRLPQRLKVCVEVLWVPRRLRFPESSFRARPTECCMRCLRRTANCSGSSTRRKNSRRSTGYRRTAANSLRSARSCQTECSS